LRLPENVNAIPQEQAALFRVPERDTTERRARMKSAALILLSCMALAACGGTTKKTVVVNPPSDSTTVVDSDGNTHVVTPRKCEDTPNGERC
jgi:hypothetical protein